jgi:hypothetical protein
VVPLDEKVTRSIEPTRTLPALRRRLLLVVATVIVVALAWPPVFRALVGRERPWRMALAIARSCAG